MIPAQDRYHRQALLAEIGPEGQARLGGGGALIVGCGALGTVIAEMLARAGVGRLTIVDRDVVELTNLQRQVLFDEADARERTPKAAAAASKLARVNSSVRIRGVVADFSWRNAEALALGTDSPESLGPAGVILDATDNFEARYLINDLSVKLVVPWVYGAAVGTDGMCAAFDPARAGGGPCLRCVFEDPPAPGSAGAGETCDTVGVLGPVTAIVANLQATEAIKILSGRVESVSRGLTSIDPWSGLWRVMDLSGAKRADCPCCGGRNFEFLDGRRGSPAAALCGRGSVQVSPPPRAAGAGAGRIDLPALAARLAPHGTFEATRFLVRGVLAQERGDEGSPIELTVFADGRAIVGGTTQPERARAVVARYVGG